MAKKNNLKTKRINVRATEQIFNAMKDYAEEFGLSDSEVVSLALEKLCGFSSLLLD